MGLDEGFLGMALGITKLGCSAIDGVFSVEPLVLTLALETLRSALVRICSGGVEEPKDAFFSQAVNIRKPTRRVSNGFGNCIISVRSKEFL